MHTTRVALHVLALMATASCGLKSITSPGTVALTLTGAPGTAVAGLPVSFTVSAIDSTGQTATGYSGTVTVTSSDPTATEPGDYTFSAADEGIKTFSSAFTFGTAGSQILVVTDTGNPELVANANVVVSPASLHCQDYGGTPTTAPTGAGMNLAAPIKDMVLDFNEDPVLVYLAATNAGTYAYAKTWAGSAWAPYGGISVSPVTTAVPQAGTPHLVLDSVDHPQIAFAVADPNAPGSAEVLLLRWTGTAWQGLGGSETAAGMAGVVSAQALPEVALTLDANNRPWVAWDHDTPNEVRTLAWSGSAWAAQGNVPLAASARRPALAVPPSGRAVAAWTNSSGAQPVIVAQQWNGAAWVPLGDNGVVSSGTGPVQSDRPRIAFQSDGTPVVAWEALNRSGVINVYARHWTGTLWADLASSGLGNGVSASTGSGAQHPALAVDSEDHVWMAWEDLRSSQIYLRKYVGGAWVEVGSSASGGGISATSLQARWPQLQVTGRGVAILSWEEVSGTNYVVHVCPWK